MCVHTYYRMCSLTAECVLQALRKEKQQLGQVEEELAKVRKEKVCGVWRVVCAQLSVSA